MEPMSEVKYPGLRWVVLVLLWMGIVACFWAQMITAGMAHYLMPALGLTVPQLTMLVTGVMITFAVFSLPGGMLGDRIGTRTTLFIGILLAGIGGLLRAYSASFVLMFTYTLIMGIGVGFLMANMSKVVAYWFPPKEMHLALGIAATGIGVGSSIGLATGALFASYAAGFLTTGIIALAVAVLWVIVARSTRPGVALPPPPPWGEHLKVAARSKTIWLLAAVMFFFQAGFMGVSAVMPIGLQVAHGVNPVTAGLVASVFTIGGFVGNIFGPIIAARTGLVKPNVWVTMIICGICVYIAWATAMSLGTWIFIFIAGLALGVMAPAGMVYPVMLPEIGPAFAGVGLGMVTAIGMVGGFVMPSFVLTPLAAGNFSLMFIFFAIVIVISGLIFLPAPEIGPRGRKE